MLQLANVLKFIRREYFCVYEIHALLNLIMDSGDQFTVQRTLQLLKK